MSRLAPRALALALLSGLTLLAGASPAQAQPSPEDLERDARVRASILALAESARSSQGEATSEAEAASALLGQALRQGLNRPLEEASATRRAAGQEPAPARASGVESSINQLGSSLNRNLVLGGLNATIQAPEADVARREPGQVRTAITRSMTQGPPAAPQSSWNPFRGLRAGIEGLGQSLTARVTSTRDAVRTITSTFGTNVQALGEAVAESALSGLESIGLLDPDRLGRDGLTKTERAEVRALEQAGPDSYSSLREGLRETVLERLRDRDGYHGQIMRRDLGILREIREARDDPRALGRLAARVKRDYLYADETDFVEQSEEVRRGERRRDLPRAELDELLYGRSGPAQRQPTPEERLAASQAAEAAYLNQVSEQLSSVSAQMRAQRERGYQPEPERAQQDGINDAIRGRRNP